MLERPSSSSSHPLSDCSAGCALGVVEERPFAIMANFHTPSQFRVVGAGIHEPSMCIVSALDVARRGDLACRIDHSVSSHSGRLPQPTFLQSSIATTADDLHSRDVREAGGVGVRKSHIERKCSKQYRRLDRYGFTPPGHRQGRGADRRVLDVLGREPFHDDVLATSGTFSLRPASTTANHRTTTLQMPND